MKVFGNQGRFVVDLNYWMPQLHNPNLYAGTTALSILAQGDPIIGFLTSTKLYTGPQLVTDLTHEYRVGSLSFENEHELRPPINQLPPDLTEDYRRYGSIFSSFRLFLDFLGITVPSRNALSSEKEVVHSKWIGDYTLTPPGVQLFSDDPSGVNVKCARTNNHHFSAYSFAADYAPSWINRATTPLGPTYGVHYRDLYGRPFSFLHVRLAELGLMVQAHELHGVGFDGYTWYDYDVTSFDYTKIGTWGYRITYSAKVNNSPDYPGVLTNPANASTYTVVVDIYPEFIQPVFDGDAPDGVIQTTRLHDIHYAFQATIASHGGWYDWAGYYTNGLVMSYTGVVETYWNFSTEVYSSRNYDQQLLARLYNRSPLTEFESSIRMILPDIRPSAYISSSDAVQDALSGISGNLLQTLQKLPEIAGSIPDLKGMLAALRTIIADFKITSIVDLLKLLASENLKFNFSTRGLIALITDVLPKIGRIIDRLHNLEHEPLKAHGNFMYTFPEGTFGRKDSIVQTRSTFNVNSYPGGPLTKILDLKALGVLPSASSIFDLIQWTFAVNWFLNLSARLKSLENFSILSALDIKSVVHSYKFISPLQDDELSRYDLFRSDPVGSDILVVYIREVSRFVPLGRYTRFDFGAPVNKPPWHIVGSLLIGLT
jgi:hypothetical protein